MFPDQLVDSCLFGQWGVERVCAGLFERDTYRHRNMILFNLSNLPAPFPINKWHLGQTCYPVGYTFNLRVDVWFVERFRFSELTQVSSD